MTSKLPKVRSRSTTRSNSGGSSSSNGSIRSVASSRASSCTRSKVSHGLNSPILGKNFSIPDLYSELLDIQLDDTLPYVPVYCHFVVPEIEPIVRPTTPPILKALRAELEELQLIKPVKMKTEQKSRNTPRVNHRQSNKNRTDAN